MFHREIVMEDSSRTKERKLVQVQLENKNSSSVLHPDFIISLGEDNCKDQHGYSRRVVDRMDVDRERNQGGPYSDKRSVNAIVIPTTPPPGKEESPALHVPVMDPSHSHYSHSPNTAADYDHKASLSAPSSPPPPSPPSLQQQQQQQPLLRELMARKCDQMIITNPNEVNFYSFLHVHSIAHFHYCGRSLVKKKK
ncbi:hypothetical protein RFI_05340 [Reticulomyxa filosa]|uniref:Uncharacterized protein n=1 Tax=Reticulomyxa filosa TaxID=46433 RepID=X6P122_RETFI|nr:hypothetical protein RFI_05340 [Reticulomyxa filosa]|eukprot:ETO31779.1 hypothetical protein RFI_05340 [Reticulomyxa filosa]